MTATRYLLLLLATILTLPGPDYAQALASFFKEMDAKYRFFKEKRIQDSWTRLKGRLLKEARRCRDHQTFNRIMNEAVAGLRDGHAWFEPGHPPEKPGPEPRFCGLSLAPFGKSGVVVLGGTRAAIQRVPAGSVIVTIGGKNARKLLDRAAKEAWKRGGDFSSPQRARFQVYRIALRDAEEKQVKLVVKTAGRQRRVTLPVNVKARNWLRSYNLPRDLQQAARSIWYARLEGEIGYVWMRRMDETAEEGFRKAIAGLKGARAWIVDLRGNSGGGYDRSLAQALRDLKGPVAGIIDAGTFSAGETFARDLVKQASARLFGQLTAGSSSTKAIFELPEGLGRVRYSVASRRGYDGKPIEYRGIAPHQTVEPDPKDLSAGRNTEIEVATKWIARSLR